MSRDLEETVGVNLEGGDELGLTAGHRWDAVELELAEETVVTALGTLTLIAAQITLQIRQYNTNANPKRKRTQGR